MSLSLGFSLMVLVASLALYGDVARGWGRLRQLRDVAPILPPNPPAVSVIVAARDEARVIEPAIRSLLAIAYPALEIAVVDDRSTDATGDILDRLRLEFPNLQVLHISDLPAGWLGKNHALHRGGENARGAYLIFSDADVIFEKSSVSRAVAHCEAERLDHLTVIPSITARSLFLALSMMGGFVGILALHRPWRARESGKHGLGVGAFNMVKAVSYREAGGHQTLAMEVLDDIELGRLMGKEHRRQEVLLGDDMVALEMYRSAMEMFLGIQKNVFTFLDYSAPKLLAATAVTFSFSVWPWIGPFLTEGAARWMNLGSAAAAILLYGHLAPKFGYSRWCVAWLPVTGVVSIFLFWQVAIRTWLSGGIVWRGTFYKLSEIRGGRRLRGR